MTVEVDEPSATIVAEPRPMVTTGAAACTDRDAVPVAPDFVAVTVCGPAVVAVQTFAVHEPSGVMVNVAVAVTSPRLLPAASRPCAVNVRLAPASIVAVPGDDRQVVERRPAAR